MSFEFDVPLQTVRESFVLATSRYVDEHAATSRERAAIPPNCDNDPPRTWQPTTYADDLYFAVWPDGQPVLTVTSNEPM